MQKYLRFIDMVAVAVLAFSIFYKEKPVWLVVGVVLVAFIWIVSHAIDYIQHLK